MGIREDMHELTQVMARIYQIASIEAHELLTQLRRVRAALLQHRQDGGASVRRSEHLVTACVIVDELVDLFEANEHRRRPARCDICERPLEGGSRAWISFPGGFARCLPCQKGLEIIEPERQANLEVLTRLANQREERNERDSESGLH